jgi:predicted AAA+ superfamily ATPase
LELPSAQRQLDDPGAFFLAHPKQLVILDEVQRLPDLFSVLRGVIDQRRRDGEASRQFLLLGSASGVLLKQSSESLAGRVAQLELTPFQAREVLRADEGAQGMNTLWVRGGFPLSWMAPNDAQSLSWREAFITTYLEKDIPALGPRIPSTTLRRLWTMLAHNQGELLDQSKLAAALETMVADRRVKNTRQQRFARHSCAWSTQRDAGKWRTARRKFCIKAWASALGCQSCR